MRTLHVAAMPFPTVQGTQASIRAMLDVLAGIGRETHLLTYARAGYELDPTYRIHRIGDFPVDRSLRSGPSWRKAALDVRLVAAVRRLAREIEPDVIVAHHVEAASACIAARVKPIVYFAHTALAPELPVYVPRMPRRVVAAAGLALERTIVSRVHAVAAISPALAARFEAELGTAATYVPVAWPVPEPLTRAERADARRALGVPVDAEIVLYAGNLDAYQGWDVLLDAVALVARARPKAHLAVATTSNTDALHTAARARSVDRRVLVLPLEHERDRRAAHAIADVAVAPRRVPGGLPIKLLDAMARGVPAVTTVRAASGLDVGGAALVVRDDDADALGSAIRLALSTPSTRDELGARGRAYVLSAHAPQRLVDALDAVSEAAMRAASA